ncbi:MAG: DUF2092 domain-containing protein [Deltaproteobacteria bacterium]|nr:DUF2092 domain-containing protein [Deltaproteobacteria bacterium]
MGAPLLPIAYCLFFTGCASFSPPLVTEGNKISGEQNVCPDPAISALLQKKSENLQTLKGSAQIKTVLKDGREIAGRAAIIVKRPDKFRLEISGPFNQTAFIIIYNGEKISLFSFQENKLYTDYPLPAEASRLPQYLLGLPSSKNSEHEAEGINSGDEQILINHECNIKEIISSGAKVSIDSYEEIDGFNFPFAISINNKEADIFIRYDHIELNRHIPDDLFNWEGN